MLHTIRTVANALNWRSFSSTNDLFFPAPPAHCTQKRETDQAFFHNRQKKILKVEEALQPILTVFGGVCKCQQIGLKVVGISSDLINGNEQISKELFKTFY